MYVLKFLAVVLFLLSSFSAIAEETEFKFSRLKATSDLPEVVVSVWQNTPDHCSEGYDPEQDLIADLYGAVVEGKDNNRIYILPCGTPAAYNTSEIIIAVNYDNSEVRLLPIPSISNDGPTANTLGHGLQWDEEGSVITSFYKGRGLGDCSGNSELKWDGEFYSNLVLVEQYFKIECDGKNDEWPKVWPVE